MTDNELRILGQHIRNSVPRAKNMSKYLTQLELERHGLLYQSEANVFAITRLGATVLDKELYEPVHQL